MSYTEIGHEHLEKLEDTHILLFHEEQKKAEEIEFKFIKTGLDKKQTCSIPQMILKNYKIGWKNLELKLTTILKMGY